MTSKADSTPLMISGRSMNSEGPGTMPCTTNTPMMMAVMASPGMPSVSTVIMAPPELELLALSAATMPSGLPSPKGVVSLAPRCAQK